MYRKRACFMCMGKQTGKKIIILSLDNVALHKAAWQQHPHGNDEFNASLAVDGRKSNLSILGAECVVSAVDTTAEWRVDLKEVLSIHHIAIQYVQSQLAWSMYFL